jgi:transposase
MAGSRWARPETDHKEVPMRTLYYIGLDIHKKMIASCIKAFDGHLIRQGKIDANRKSVGEWAHGLPGPWVGAMEATIFTGWIYDFLTPYAVDVKVAHPEMLKAITAAKKKNDCADAEMITDLLRVNLLPECHMLSEEIRELQRILRYRNHVVRTAVKMQNKMSGLLMEVGVSYSKKRLHGEKYFDGLLERVDEIPQSVKELLKLSRAGFEMFYAVQKRLIKALRTSGLMTGEGSASDDDPRSWRGNCIDLGIGDRRSLEIQLYSAGHQLLRSVHCPTGIGRQRATGTNFQEAQ